MAMLGDAVYGTDPSNALSEFGTVRKNRNMQLRGPSCLVIARKMASTEKSVRFSKSVQRSGHKRALNAPVNQKGRWKNNILVKVRSATSNNNAVNPSIQFIRNSN